MRIVVIDGQGGRMGSALVERIKAALPEAECLAVGTNSTATAAMLRAGADAGATGENPVLVNARTADVIAGPVGILAANALYGEVTPAMARAIGESRALKLLLPVNRCGVVVVGVREQPLGDYIREAVERIRALSAQRQTVERCVKTRPTAVGRVFTVAGRRRASYAATVRAQPYVPVSPGARDSSDGCAARSSITPLRAGSEYHGSTQRNGASLLAVCHSPTYGTPG